MPKLRKDVEDKMLALILLGYTNAEVSEKTGIHRKTVAERRKAHLNRKPDARARIEEEITQQEPPEVSPLEQQIHTLMEEQETNSAYEAISQAIETQHNLNPYLSKYGLKHGLKTPADLITFFEDKIREHALLEQTPLEYDPYNFSRDLTSIEGRLEIVDSNFRKGFKSYEAARYIVRANQRITKDEKDVICQKVPMDSKTLEGVLTKLRKLELYPPRPTSPLESRRGLQKDMNRGLQKDIKIGLMFVKVTIFNGQAIINLPKHSALRMNLLNKNGEPGDIRYLLVCPLQRGINLIPVDMTELWFER